MNLELIFNIIGLDLKLPEIVVFSPRPLTVNAAIINAKSAENFCVIFDIYSMLLMKGTSFLKQAVKVLRKPISELIDLDKYTTTLFLKQ